MDINKQLIGATSEGFLNGEVEYAQNSYDYYKTMSQEDLLAYTVGYVPEKMAKKARLFDFTETDFPQGFGFNPTIRYKTNVNGSIPFAFITRPVRNIDYKTVGTISKLSGSPKLLMTGNINLNNASTAPSGAFVTKYNHEAVRAQRVSSVGEEYSQSPLTMALQVSYGIVACQEPDLTTAMVKAPEIEEGDENGLIIISGQDVLTCNFEYTLWVGKDKVPITLNKEWWEQNPDGEFRFIQDVSGGCYWGCRFIIEKIYSSFVWGFNDYSAAFIGEDYLQHTHDMSETNLGQNVWRSVSTSSGFWRNHANWPDRGLQGISNNHSVNNNSMATDLGEDGLFVRWWQTSTYQGYAVFKGWTPTDYFLKLALAAPTFYVEGTADTATWYTAEYDKNYCLTGNIIPVNEVKNNWQLDMTPNNNTFDGVTMPEPSPEPPEPSADAINLWSYKRDNVSPLVAGIFPYNGGDAGEGEFIGMIRSKLTSDVVRDENGELKINLLKIELEDVIRKSAGEDCLIGYLRVEEPDLNSYDASTEYFKNDNLSAAQNEILDINLQSGFYQGEVCSYISASNPSFVITVKKEWNGQPLSDDTNYEATLICENRKTDEVIQTITATSQGATTLRFSNLRAYDENDELIEYTIYEELPEDSPWRCTVEDKVITYNSEEKIVRVKNDWAETAVDNNAKVITQVFVNDISGVEEYNAEHGIDSDPQIYLRSFGPFISDEDITNNESGFNLFLNTFLKGKDGSGSDEAKAAWIYSIKKSDAYKKLASTNSAAFFCSKYIWRQYYWKEVNGQQTMRYDSWCEMSPFFSIVVRDSDGKEQFYSFSTKITNYGGTGLDEIPYPYVSSRVRTLVGDEFIDSVGYKSTALQWKRGAAGADAEAMPWVDSSSTENPKYSGPPLSGTVCYSGEPTGISGPTPYRYTAGNLAYSSIDIKSEDGDVLLKNFCIFCADRMCMDSNVAGDLVPYFYKVSVKDPIDSSGFGVLEMKISKVDKSDSFAPNTNTIDLHDQSGYRYHQWSQNWDATNNPYTIKKTGGTDFEINQPALRSALEGNNGIFYDHIEAEDTYKSIFAGGGDN